MWNKSRLRWYDTRRVNELRHTLRLAGMSQGDSIRYQSTWRWGGWRGQGYCFRTVCKEWDIKGKGRCKEELVDISEGGLTSTLLGRTMMTVEATHDDTTILTSPQRRINQRFTFHNLLANAKHSLASPCLWKKSLYWSVCAVRIIASSTFAWSLVASPTRRSSTHTTILSSACNSQLLFMSFLFLNPPASDCWSQWQLHSVSSLSKVERRKLLPPPYH